MRSSATPNVPAFPSPWKPTCVTAWLRRGLGGADQIFLLTPHGPDQDLLERAAADTAVTAGAWSPVGRISQLGRARAEPW